MEAINRTLTQMAIENTNLRIKVNEEVVKNEQLTAENEQLKKENEELKKSTETKEE